MPEGVNGEERAGAGIVAPGKAQEPDATKRDCLVSSAGAYGELQRRMAPQ